MIVERALPAVVIATGDQARGGRISTEGAHMIKRIAATTGAIAATVMLTACGTGDGDSTRETNLTPQVITVDGREVTCVTYPSGFVGGIDCDWEGAR